MRKSSMRDLKNERHFLSARLVMLALLCATLGLALAPGAAFAWETKHEKKEKAEAAAADAARAAEAAKPAPTGDEVGAPMACSTLATQKYPFLTCVRGVSGGPVFATVGQGIELPEFPIKGKFVKGDGYWGPSSLE